MTDEKYNGWSNYETWLMNLNLTNEEGLYNEVHDMAKQISDNYDLGQALKDWVEETFSLPDPNEDIIKVCDSWTYRDFQEINWTEIAESLREE